MNFLAHFLLTPDDDELIVGQMLGDFTERGWRERASPRVQEGVRLHQKIDVFADRHAVVEAARRRFESPYRRYAGVMLDVYFDHVLARDFGRYGGGLSLGEFSRRCYGALERAGGGTPPRMQRAMRSMREHDWLGAYATIDGVRGALRGIARRLRRANPLAEGAELLAAMDTEIAADFETFWPQLEKFAESAYRSGGFSRHCE